MQLVTLPLQSPFTSSLNEGVSSIGQKSVLFPSAADPGFRGGGGGGRARRGVAMGGAN